MDKKTKADHKKTRDSYQDLDATNIRDIVIWPKIALPNLHIMLARLLEPGLQRTQSTCIFRVVNNND